VNGRKDRRLFHPLLLLYSWSSSKRENGCYNKTRGDKLDDLQQREETHPHLRLLQQENKQRAQNYLG